MNHQTIEVDASSGLFALLGKAFKNPFLAWAIIFLLAWKIFHGWWWQEDVCEARYKRADAIFRKENARKNGVTEKVGKSARDQGIVNKKERTQKLQHLNDMADRHKSDAVMPRKLHGTVQEVK